MACFREKTAHLWGRMELNGGELEDGMNHEESMDIDKMVELAEKINLPEGDDVSSDEWCNIKNRVILMRPDLAEIIQGETDENQINNVLEAFIWYACVKSECRKSHIGCILKLESDLQDEIKAILTEQREMDEEYQIRLEEEEEEAERRCQQAEIEEEGKKVSRAEVEELEEKVESMSQQLEDCKSRERELELFLDEKTKQFQEASKACLDEEMRTIDQQKEIDEQCAIISKLREQNEKLTSEVDKKDAYINELSDKLDLAEECERKLTHATCQLAKYKEKMEEMADIKDQLAAEQEARACSVEKVISLESQLSIIPSLKKQIDEYKQKITNFELETRKMTKEISKKNGALDEIERLKTALRVQAEEHQAVTAKFQHELELSGGIQGPIGMSFAGTELSPELSEKIARLESENKTLKSLLSEHDTDKVASIVNALDDEKRVSATYESQLDETTELLSASQKHVAELQDSVKELKKEVSLIKAHKEKLSVELLREKTNRENDRQTYNLEMERFNEKVEHDQQTASLRTEAALWLQKCFSQHHIQMLSQEFAKLTELHNEVTKCLEEKVNECKEAQNSVTSLKASIDQLQQDVETLKANHETNITEMKTSFENVLETKEKEFSAKVETMKHESENKLVQMSDSFDEDRKKLQADLKERMEAKDQEVIEYQQNYSVSNEQHKQELDKIQQQCEVLKLQLREADESIEMLEGKARKMGRENQFLKDELNEAAASGGSGGSSKTAMMELTSLQKEYKALSDQLKACQAKVRMLESGCSSSSFSNSSNSGALNSAALSGPFETSRTTRSSSRSAGGSGNMNSVLQVYDQRAEQLEEEKREMLMKCTAAVADREQAVQEVSKLKHLLTVEKEKSTALELQKERAMRGLQQLKSAQKNKSAHKAQNDAAFLSPPPLGDKENVSTTSSPNIVLKDDMELKNLVQLARAIEGRDSEDRLNDMNQEETCSPS